MNSTHEKQRLPFQPDEPVSPGAHGREIYGASGLLASSADRGWSDLTAELRSHSGTIAWKGVQPDTEVCVAVRDHRSVVTRQRYGITDRTVSERGTIWLSPPVVGEGLIDLSDPVPAILHIYLPPSRFAPESFDKGLAPHFMTSLRHEGSFRDPLVAEIAYALVSDWNARPLPAGCSRRRWPRAWLRDWFKTTWAGPRRISSRLALARGWIGAGWRACSITSKPIWKAN
jgi:AraC family transcriptional regulator